MEIRSFTPQEMEHLLDVEAPLYLSLYLHQDTATLAAKKARAHKLVRAAQASLAEHHLPPVGSEALLEPLRATLLEPEIWRGQRGSLALFKTPTEYFGYHIPLGLPERVVVGNQFFIKPLVPLLAWARPFYILAVSQHQARLLQCTYDTVSEIQAEGMPHNLDDALSDMESEKQHQVRSTPAFGAGRGMAIRYGEGGAQEEHKARLDRYLRLIDAAVHRTLARAHAPMVFAGVEYLFPMFQQLTTYPQLYKFPLKGNPDRVRVETLHMRARELLCGYFEEPRCEALAQYRELYASERTLSDMESIVNAAREGRVQALFLDRQADEWGEYDSGTRQVLYRPQPGSDGTELSNLAAILTLKHQGKAFLLDTPEMPGQAGMAAVLRY